MRKYIKLRLTHKIRIKQVDNIGRMQQATFFSLLSLKF